jgi:hypothetical protein
MNNKRKMKIKKKCKAEEFTEVQKCKSEKVEPPELGVPKRKSLKNDVIAPGYCSVSMLIR